MRGILLGDKLSASDPLGFSRSRSIQLTKIISLLLKVYNRGVKWGLTMSHTVTIDKVEQLGKDYDEKVLKWKAEQERHNKFQMTLETISECIEECEAPLCDDRLRREVKDRLHTDFNETVYDDLSKLLANIATVDSNKMDEVRLLQKEINSNRPSGYQISGDNVDLMIKVRHQASECSDDEPLRKAQEVENWEVLPSSKDTQDLLHDFIPLVARVIVDRIPAFKHFKDVVVRHLPHQYSDVMKEKSEQVSIICLSLYISLKYISVVIASFKTKVFNRNRSIKKQEKPFLFPCLQVYYPEVKNIVYVPFR